MDTEGQVSPSEKARSSMGVDYQVMHKSEMPSDSPSRSFNSLPIYHFHGLAATQTQTSQNEETTFQRDESSQKENISARSTVDGDHTSCDPDHSTAFEAPPKVPTFRVPSADQAIPTPLRVTKVLLPRLLFFFQYSRYSVCFLSLNRLLTIPFLLSYHT